jgi:hypothetical protein
MDQHPLDLEVRCAWFKFFGILCTGKHKEGERHETVKIAPVIGSKVVHESRWIKDTCTGFSPWETHRILDLGHQI